MKQLPTVVLIHCSFMGVSLCRLHVPSAFGGRIGLDVVASHVFPQDVLAAITFEGDEGGDQRVKACTVCEVGLPFC